MQRMLVILAVFCLGSSSLRGDTISTITNIAFSGPGGIGTAFLHPEAGLAPNEALVVKDYLLPDVIDMHVTTDGAGAVKFDETITNSTGYIWTDFTWELALGDPDDGLFFSDVLAYSDHFTILEPSLDELRSTGAELIRLSGGRVEDGETLSISYEVTVPGATTFTISQYDVAIAQEPVPAPPGVVGLVGIALVGLPLVWRRRRRAG